MEIWTIMLHVVGILVVLLIGMWLHSLLQGRGGGKRADAPVGADGAPQAAAAVVDAEPAPRVKVLGRREAMPQEEADAHEDGDMDAEEDGGEAAADQEGAEAAEIDLSYLTPLIHNYCVEERHFTDPTLNIITLAKGVGSNRTYVWKYFSQQGTNFNTYISDLRSDYAAELLRTTSQNVNEIGVQAGFRTTNTFIVSFKRRFGVTPKRYQLADRQPT